MQFLKNIFAPIGAVLGFINKYFKSLIFLLILFLIFAGGEGTQQKGANLAQLSLSGAIMDDSEILEKIETLKNDEAIKGVLLLIDSPGGALSPSVEISLAIKSLNSRKPVVAYAKGTMASGSYLGGVWASKIYANPGSFIGSIGVIMQGLDVSEAAAKLGFAEQIVKAGELKEAGTMMRKWSDAERASLQALVDESYELFTWANARVFLASGAKGVGLIDEVGSLEDAKSALIKTSGVADPIWQEPSAYEKMIDKLANKSESLVRGAFGAKLMAY